MASIRRVVEARPVANDSAGWVVLAWDLPDAMWLRYCHCVVYPAHYLGEALQRAPLVANAADCRLHDQIAPNSTEI